MSVDLYVWHEAVPVGADEAVAKLDRRDEDEAGVFVACPAVARFYDSLLDRFPALESLREDDVDRLGVWSMTPTRSDSIVVASCVRSRASEVRAAVIELAAEHGLVCYDPGYHVITPNAPGYDAPFTLSSAALPTFPDPDAHRLEWIMDRVGTDNEFVILERADG